MLNCCHSERRMHPEPYGISCKNARINCEAQKEINEPRRPQEQPQVS